METKSVTVSETISDSNAEIKHIEIRRRFPFQSRPRDLFAETREERWLARIDRREMKYKYSLPMIYAEIKLGIDRSIPSFMWDGEDVIIFRAKRIVRMYKIISESVEQIHKRMPEFLMKSYLQIDVLFEDIEDAVRACDTEKSVTILTKVGDILFKTKEIIESFWKKRPELALRLPSVILKNILSEDLFESHDYLPYTFGAQPLPAWTDPMVVSIINKTRMRIGLPEHLYEIISPEMLIEKTNAIGERIGNSLKYTIVVDF